MLASDWIMQQCAIHSQAQKASYSFSRDTLHALMLLPSRGLALSPGVDRKGIFHFSHGTTIMIHCHRRQRLFRALFSEPTRSRHRHNDAHRNVVMISLSSPGGTAGRLKKLLVEFVCVPLCLQVRHRRVRRPQQSMCASWRTRLLPSGRSTRRRSPLHTLPWRLQGQRPPRRW